MSDYTLYCTEEQTKKALELCAKPKIIDSQERVKKKIERIRDTYGISSCEYRNATYYLVEVRYKNVPNIVVVNQVVYKLPTAEQMIGWLETHKIFIHVNPCSDVCCNWHISSKGYNKYGYTSDISVCKSRKEATLAAIDAALEHLSNK